MSLFALFYMIFAYLLGSISSAILICKVAGLPDPRKNGSHNPPKPVTSLLKDRKLIPQAPPIVRLYVIHWSHQGYEIRFFAGQASLLPYK